MHHRPEYECVTERGKINASCLGLKTPRRGVLIRHLKICHKTGMVAGREQVLDLHDKLWENWKKEEEVIGTLRPTMAVICEVSPRTSAKLNARMIKNSQHNRFDLPEETYQKVLKWRQKSGKPNLRSPRTQSPGATVNKKKRTEIVITAPLSTVPAVGQRQPSPLSGGASYRDAAWGSPSAYKDWFSLNFPGVGKPGPESQTLTTLGRGKSKTPVVGGRGNALVQTATSVGRGRGTPKPQADAASTTARIPDTAVPRGDGTTPPVGPPVPLRPVGELPPGALSVPVRHGSTYFQPGQEKSCEIQTAIFKDWQDAHQAYTTRYVSDVVLCTLNAVHQIHVREKDVLKQSKDEELDKAISQAKQAATQATNSSIFYLEENKKLTLESNAKDIKFIGALGVRMDKWDGTLEHLERLCAEKRQKDAAPPKV